MDAYWTVVSVSSQYTIREPNDRI